MLSQSLQDALNEQVKNRQAQLRRVDCFAVLAD